MQNNTPRLPMRSIRKLIGQSLRLKAQARAKYILSADRQAEVRALLPVGTPVKLRDGRTFILRDNYAERDVAFTSAKVERFVLEEVKPVAVRPAREKGADA